MRRLWIVRRLIKGYRCRRRHPSWYLQHPFRKGEPLTGPSPTSQLATIYFRANGSKCPTRAEGDVVSSSHSLFPTVFPVYFVRSSFSGFDLSSLICRFFQFSTFLLSLFLFPSTPFQLDFLRFNSFDWSVLAKWFLFQKHTQHSWFLCITIMFKLILGHVFRLGHRQPEYWWHKNQECCFYFWNWSPAFKSPQHKSEKVHNLQLKKNSNLLVR